MIKHILAIVATLAATPAMAQNAKVIQPEEYDHPFQGKLYIKRAETQTEIKWNCAPTIFPYHLGCAKLVGDGCYILMAEDDFIRSKGWKPEIVLRHEIGHCNGWPGDHRGAR